MPESTLRVENVSVGFGFAAARNTALDDVSLSFEPGTLTLVMGPSGSGKTTLLSVLGALLRPDSGRVFLDETEMGPLDEEERTRLRRSRIGFVFQAFRLFHALSVIENVMIAADVHGPRTERRRQSALTLLERLGLEKKLSLKPKHLSRGEKQRVAIARALLADPPVLLADEPTASLDSNSGMQICGILRELSKENRRTAVVVSHDERWRTYADRTIVLEDGRVIKEDRENL